MEKEKLFTIGQFAALHSINKKTLMWYDQVDLFKPAAVKENGYRFYTYQQSPVLETILLLRELDMSIAEIKRFLSDRSAEAYIQLLREKRTEVDSRLRRLEEIRRTLTSQEAAFTALLQTDLSKIDLVERNEEYCSVIASEASPSLQDEIEKMIDAVKKHSFKSLHETTYGSLISVSSLMNLNFDQYDGLFMKLPHPAPSTGFHIKLGGKYLRAYCKGSWDKLPQKYLEILNYAEKHRLELIGYAYETGVNEMTISTIDEYITQIEIMVKTPGCVIE